MAAADEKQSEGFDEAWYISRYPDLAAAVKEGRLISGLSHYLSHGKAEGRFPSQSAETAALAHPGPQNSAAAIALEEVLLEALRKNFEPVLQKYVADNSTTVINRLSPMVRNWMDEYFPALLEDAIRREVARVVGARHAR